MGARQWARRTYGLVAALVSGANPIDAQIHELRQELREVRGELRSRLLQYNHQLGRLARRVDAHEEDEAVPLSGRAMPLDGHEPEPLAWDGVGGGIDAPDPEGREWLELEACAVCGHAGRTLVNPWNKLILLRNAPDHQAARYDYAVCHACGVLYATRRPTGERYRFLLAHFGEVTAKRGGGAEIANRLLNPYPLTHEDREELRRLVSHGVFVSDHLGLTQKQYLAPLMRDRFENSIHVDILGTLLEPRGARVLEVRSRAGTIVDGLRRAWNADVYAMPIWESQQLLLRELFGIPTSELIDFERFTIPFEGTFDLIVCNHMLTHAVHPRAFFAELRRKLNPGGHVYLYTEPDDAEFLDGNQSMFATLNPLHMQAFDQTSLVRALTANGFEPVFVKRRNLLHLALARCVGDPAPLASMSDRDRARRVDAYTAAYDRAVLGVDESLRGRFGLEWNDVVRRAVAAGVADYDERGQLRLVERRARA